VKKTQAIHSKANAARTWKQFEDHLIPRLRLSAIDRAFCSHLLNPCATPSAASSLTTSCAWSSAPMSATWFEVRLPHEVRAVSHVLHNAQLESAATKPIRKRFLVEQADFFHHPERRRAIHAREGGLCFYVESASTVSSCASTTSFRASTPVATPTATSFPAAPSAIRRRTSGPRPIFSAGSNANRASPPPNSLSASAPSTPSLRANSSPAYPEGRKTPTLPSAAQNPQW